MRTILVLCLMNLFALQAIFSIDGFSQSCNNGIQDGDEFRQDCGGSVCADCIPLLYKVECEDGVGETGIFELSVYLPSYLWTDDVLVEYFYEFGGDLNFDCLAVNECQGFSDYQEGNLAQVFIYKRSIPDQDLLLGYGSITGELYCVKSDLTSISCPDSLDRNLSATYEEIPLDDSDSHMLKIEISGGTPPYSIRDNNTDDFFYKIGILESTYYLGALPNGVELDLDIIDINECVEPILRFDGSDCTSGYSITVADADLDCEGEELETGSIILKDQGTCKQTLEFNGIQSDTIRGLTSGSYTFNVVNLTNNTMEELTRTVPTGNYEPLKLNFTSFPPGVCGDATLGSIDVSATGGIPAYSYQWTDCIDCGSSRSGLDFGTYTVEVSDEYGCRTTQTIELKANENDVSSFNVYPTFHDLEAKLQFCLDSESRVTLSAYAVNGQYLGTVIDDEVLDGGGHMYSSFTSGFPSGVYFYVLEIEGEDTRVVKTVKM